MLLCGGKYFIPGTTNSLSFEYFQLVLFAHLFWRSKYFCRLPSFQRDLCSELKSYVVCVSASVCV